MVHWFIVEGIITIYYHIITVVYMFPGEQTPYNSRDEIIDMSFDENKIGIGYTKENTEEMYINFQSSVFASMHIT